jgi:CubicO group peptidase (beta-lactamase class C family)
MKSVLLLLYCVSLAFLAAASTSAIAVPAERGGNLSTRSPSQPRAETLVVDTPSRTIDGNGFVAPVGWSIKRAGSALILTAPEGDSHVALIDTKAEDVDAAVAAGWAAYDSKAKRPVKLANDRPKRDGWEQIRSYTYETSASEARAVSVQAFRRRDGRWTIAIYDVADAVGEKRESQIDLIYQKLWPKGYSRESFAGKTAHELDAARIEDLRQFVESARQKFDVPGVAIGVVQHGKMVLAEGFGVRELGKPLKVDADTLFMVASNTKAMTTLMLAKLVEAGKFSWNTPVVQVWPTFKLGDDSTTRQVLMKHLVCACTGMPRQDMEALFNSEGATPASVMATLATMRPTSKIGELYQYSNAMAAAAGFAGGHVLYPSDELGTAYDKAMQTLVFDPLGMTSTTFDFERALAVNHAAPHGQDVNGGTALVSSDISRYVVPNRPDGGAWSNVNDMLRYVRMELNKGLLPDGTRYIAEEPLLARRAQQIATGSDTGYGMGLKIDRSLGTPLVNHGGTEFGYRSDMVWLPEHDVGAVILTNADQGVGLRYPFRRHLVELLFDGKPEAAENVAVQAKRMKDKLAAERERLIVPPDSVAIFKLAARYRSAELGVIDVLREKSTVWFDFGGWKSEVASRPEPDGSVTFVTISPGKSGFELMVANIDGKRSLRMRDAQHEYVFTEAL